MLDAQQNIYIIGCMANSDVVVDDVAADDVSVDDLADAIECAVAQSNVPVGSKFRTEEQIASRLGMSRWRLRNALILLGEKGMLLRRRGSGTFLRLRPTMGNATTLQSLPHITVEDLLEHTGTEPARAMSTGVRSLRLGLLCDLNSSSHTTREINAHLVRKINAGGHQLNIQSSTHPDIELLTPEEIIDQLPNESCDGWIVQAEAAENFYSAMDKSAGSKPPVVFYGRNKSLSMRGTFVQSDGPACLAHAFEEFVNQGLTRIGMVCLRRNRHRLGYEKYDEMAEYYETMLRRHRLTYRAIEYTESEASDSVLDAMRATRRLMATDPQPEAIFVSDDHLVPGVVEVLQQLGIEPGHGVAVIVIGHYDRPLPGEYQWSQFEFSTEAIAEWTISTLMRKIHSPNLVTPSLSVKLTWRAGQTHFISR